MAKLYIANCTHQVNSFEYRVPEVQQLRRQRIEIGAQILISGETSQEQVENIIEQHLKYGLVDAAEIDRTKGFINLIYSIDKPVTPAKIGAAYDHNIHVLGRQGVENRKEAAVAASATLERDSQSFRPDSLEMTIVEEPKDGGTPKVNERLRVSSKDDGNDAPRGRASKNRRSRAA